VYYTVSVHCVHQLQVTECDNTDFDSIKCLYTVYSHTLCVCILQDMLVCLLLTPSWLRLQPTDLLFLRNETDSYVQVCACYVLSACLSYDIAEYIHLSNWCDSTGHTERFLRQSIL